MVDCGGIFNNDGVCCAAATANAAPPAAEDGVVKVNVNVGDGENEGSVETATTVLVAALAVGVADPAAPPLVSVASDGPIADSVKLAAVFGVVTAPLLLLWVAILATEGGGTSAIVYDAIVCVVTFFGANVMVGGDGDAAVFWTVGSEEIDSVEYELFSELGYSSENITK